MTWKEKMKEIGGAALTFLTEDDEVLHFVVAGDPEKVAGKYKGNDTERAGFPIFTLEGFSLLVVGKRIVRRLSKHEDQFKKVAFEVIRHGEAGSTDTTYELNIVADKDLTAKLFEVAKIGIDKAELLEAFKDAREVASG